MSTRQMGNGRFSAGIVLIILGLLFLLKSLGIFDYKIIFDNLIAFVFIALGILIIFHGNRTSVFSKNNRGVKEFPSGDYFVVGDSIFGDLKISLEQADFKSRQYRTMFGKLDIDASHLRLAPGEHVLNLDVTFGEIKVRIPHDLPMRVVAKNLAGDVEIFHQRWEGISRRVDWTSDHYQAAEAKLKLVCSIVFGEITVV